MSTDKNKSMFMSTRYEPRDMIEDIRLSVRRGLAKLNRGNSNADSTSLPEQSYDFTVEDMTSIDICNDSRAHHRTHEWKIRDAIYMNTCWKAICGNAHLFKDKIVLDVSCDLGILSMLSAIAGAKHVYAIDTSNVVQLTRRVVADNNLTSKITVMKGKAADITLPVDKVDIIVSTSFGHALFFGNRFNEFVDARNKWLTPNGLVFPDQINYYIAAINNKMLSDRSNFWQHVYTFDMRPMMQTVKLEPYLQYVNYKQVVTNGCPIKHINLYTVEKCDYQRFDVPFRLESDTNAYIGAFITYFDVVFTEGAEPITFTTQPGWQPTHWKPMVFFIGLNDFRIDNYEEFYGVFRLNALDDDYHKIDWNIEIMHKGKYCSFRENWKFQSR